MGSMLRAVFFDVYGTLAGFRPSRFEVQSEACAQFGLRLTPEGVMSGYAAADAYMARENATKPLRLRDEEGRDRFFGEYERLILKGCGHELSAERALEIFRKVRQVPYGLAAFDDVVPTLKQLRARGLTLGMISNIDQSGEELSASLGLTDHLDLAVTSGEVGVEKPDPTIFRVALVKGCVEPDEAMHVGDQPSSDVEGALASGMAPVLIDRDGNHPWFDRCPRIHGLDELPSIVETRLAG